MSEEMITQKELDTLALSRLVPLLGIIDAIELCGDDGHNRITESGQVTARAAVTFADVAATELYEVITDRTPASVDDDYATETQHFCALAANALDKAEPYGCPGMDSATVIGALKSWGGALDERFAERRASRSWRAEAEDENGGSAPPVSPRGGSAPPTEGDGRIFTLDETRALARSYLNRLPDTIEVDKVYRDLLALLHDLAGTEEVARV
jgi:hypothetical protein